MQSQQQQLSQIQQQQQSQSPSKKERKSQSTVNQQMVNNGGAIVSNMGQISGIGQPGSLIGGQHSVQNANIFNSRAIGSSKSTINGNQAQQPQNHPNFILQTQNNSNQQQQSIQQQIQQQQQMHQQQQQQLQSIQLIQKQGQLSQQPTFMQNQQQITSNLKQVIVKSSQQSQLQMHNQFQSEYAINQQQIGTSNQIQQMHPNNVSPMPASYNGIAQPNSGAILNHHRRKQFRNLPAGSKLEQLQHHAKPSNTQNLSTVTQGPLMQQPNGASNPN